MTAILIYRYSVFGSLYSVLVPVIRVVPRTRTTYPSGHGPFGDRQLVPDFTAILNQAQADLDTPCSFVIPMTPKAFGIGGHPSDTALAGGVGDPFGGMAQPHDIVDMRKHE